MFETINSMMLWWFWIIIGIVLITAEIFVPLFVVIWFGVSAIIVGFVDYFFEIPFKLELSLWIILSILFTASWFKFYKERVVSHSGQSDNSFEVEGVVIEKIQKGEKGRVKFDSALLGDTIWYAMSDSELNIDTRVEIVEIKGQVIVVKGIR